jgi:anhydro-N-acetylmuramic acid kinase
MIGEGRGWHPGSSPRWFAGVATGRRSGRLKVAAIRGRGAGWRFGVDEVRAVTSPSPPIKDLPLVVAQRLADLHPERSLEPFEVLGVHDPPAGTLGEHGGATAIALAEATGLTTVSDFRGRDAAAGGAGAPLSPVADWLLFRSSKRRRLLVQLGTMLRVTWIGIDSSDLRTFDAGPCSGMLDRLARRLSDGAAPYDPNGRFAVQGRIAENLLAEWNQHPFLKAPPPRFATPQSFGDEFCELAIARAQELRLTAADLLCSANHFVVRCLQSAALRFLPSPLQPCDLVASGGGTHNGLLWKLLENAFAQLRPKRSDDLGVPAEAMRAVHAGLFAYCLLENLPANVPGLTGAAGPRILGVVTPGRPEHWDRFANHLADRTAAPGEAESRAA